MRSLFFSRTRNPYIQFFRYLFVGGSSTVVDFGLYTIFTEIFGIHYLIANVFAFIIAFFWNYLTSIWWIFESKHSRTREMTSVFLIATGGMLLTEVILVVLVEGAAISHLIAKVIATLAVMFWNFGMRKKYVFH